MNKYLFTAALLLSAWCADAQFPDVPLSFRKVHIWDSFYTEASSIADVNRDGKPDIIAGARWFEAPDWKPHDIWVHRKFDYTKGYSDSFLNFMTDVNEDGWIDMINFDFPGREVYWLENPGKSDVYWKRYVIDSVASNESPMMVDIDGDGRHDLVFGNEKTGQLNWWSHSLKSGKVMWQAHAISEKKSKGNGTFAHGLGWGDLNADGRKDVMIIGGWWEAPKNFNASPWAFHEADLGYPCSQMLPFDFDADGDMDVITGSAHDFGLWWHEQVKGPQQQISFVRHLIDSTYSELHSMVLKDVDRDGLPDLITGKRYYAHQGHGPGGMDPAVVYWYQLLRNGRKQPYWIRHEIDHNSGVGIQFEAEDINKDGLLDFAIGNKNGVFYFEQVENKPARH